MYLFRVYALAALKAGASSPRRVLTLYLFVIVRGPAIWQEKTFLRGNRLLDFERFVLGVLDLRELALKSGDVRKAAIDARKPDIGDFVQLT